MMQWQLISLGAFLAVLVASRIISEKASGLLDENHRAIITQSFASFRKNTFLILLSIIILYYAGVRVFPLRQDFISNIALVFLLAYAVAVNVILWKKMKSLGIPEAYVKRIVLARSMLYSAIGFILFLFLTAGEI
jgi:isoprenylcysteine carboxyl methyltransferase (ICMT) family protein YpbQ